MLVTDASTHMRGPFRSFSYDIYIYVYITYTYTGGAWEELQKFGIINIYIYI